MRLLVFPYLIQRCVVEQLDLHETFILATVSKRLIINMKNWLSRQKFAVEYNPNGCFEIERKGSEEQTVDKFVVVLKDHSDQKVDYNCQRWTLLNQELVPVKIRNEHYRTAFVVIDTYWPPVVSRYNPFEVKMLEFITQVFPNLGLTLSLRADEMEHVRDTLEFVKKLKLKMDTVVIGTSEWAERGATYDEFVKLILDECREADIVEIYCETSEGFEYDFKTPLKLKRIDVDLAHWITKSDVINYFMECEEIVLEKVAISDKQISEIVREWAKNPNGNIRQYYELDNGDFPHRSLVSGVVGHFPDAVEVQKASVRLEDKYSIIKFKDRRAYVIKAEDGTEALVFKLDNCFTLAKYFQISKEIDGMEVQIKDSLEDDSDSDDSGSDDEEDEEDEEEIEDSDEVADEGIND